MNQPPGNTFRPGLLPLPVLLFLLVSCQAPQAGSAQPERSVGGPCDGCTVIFDYGDQPLHPEATLPDFEDHTPRLKITGTIYQADGRTPAPDVLLYVYHTNAAGRYQMEEAPGAATRYVRHRGWLKTDASGRYTFYTFLPGPYPGEAEPRHIHPLVKEPGKSVYYIDDYVFADDPLLTPTKRAALEHRGGSGIVTLVPGDGLLVGQRDIVLVLHIPGY